MKKWIAFFLVFCMSLTMLIGCGENGRESQESKKEQESEKQSEKQSESESESESEAQDVYTGECDDIVYVNCAYEGDYQNGTFETPYKNIDAAFGYVEEQLQMGVEGDYVIYLCQGTYPITEELTLDGKKFTVPSDKYSIKIVGSPKGAIITSNVEISASDFEETSTRYIYEYTLPDTAKDPDGKYPEFRDFYQNNRSMSLATSRDIMSITRTVLDSARIITKESAAMGVSASNNVFIVQSDFINIKKIPRDNDGYFLDESGEKTTLEFWIKDEWEMHKLRATGMRYSSTVHDNVGNAYVEIMIQPDDFKEYVNDTHHLNGANREFFLMNHVSLVNDEGEFYYNRQTGKITLKGFFDEEFESSTFSYPLLDKLLVLQNIKNVTVENVELTGTTWNYATDHLYYPGQANRNVEVWGLFPHHSAIFGGNVENILIDSCYIHDVGLDGVYFTDIVKNLNVENSTFMNIGGSAIRIGEPDDRYDEATRCCKDVTIRNNYLDTIATKYHVCPSIFIPSSEGTLITHNTILRSYYTAISIGYNWRLTVYSYPSVLHTAHAEISYNYIEDYTLELIDGGAIYTLGGNTADGDVEFLNTTKGNVIVLRDCVGDYEIGSYWTIYHDGSSSHWYDSENMVIRDKDNMKKMYMNVYNYQVVTDQQAYRDTTDTTYTVGMTEEDVNFLVKMGRRYEDVKPQLNENGAYDFVGPTFDKYHLVFKNGYMFEDFEDAAKMPEVYARMMEIYEEAGSTIVEKPREFGVMPEVSEYR